MQLSLEMEKRYCLYCKLELTADEKFNFHSACKKEFLKFNNSKVQAFNTIGMKILFLVGIFFYSNSFIPLFDLFNYELTALGIIFYFVLLIPILLVMYELFLSLRHLDEINQNEYILYLAFNMIIMIFLTNLSDYRSDYLYWTLLAKDFQLTLIIPLLISCIVYILNYITKNYKRDTRLTITIVSLVISSFIITLINTFLIQRNFINIIANNLPYRYYFLLTCELLVFLLLMSKFLHENTLDSYLKELIDNPNVENELKKFGWLFIAEFFIGIFLLFI